MNTLFSHGPKMLSFLMFFVAISCVTIVSCKSKNTFPISSVYHSVGEHSSSTFLVMYDEQIGKEPLLKAVQNFKAEIIYDYDIIPGMAIKKPDNKSLEETMSLFKNVKGVVSVEYDQIYRIDDPIKRVIK